ncbi:Delta(12)-fatty-acid desaturase [Datura stramonium]|uniref:Delta(12)-fatty-acid desaturase n=1 Tax=Datura stramonium TaxID=4076 RepID=A0ABS8VQR9_DATST|nr:Delta(12)-fatty-acid desaturase [Datura stramonium]
MSASCEGYKSKYDVVKRVPHSKPPFHVRTHTLHCLYYDSTGMGLVEGALSTIGERPYGIRTRYSITSQRHSCGTPYILNHATLCHCNGSPQGYKTLILGDYYQFDGTSIWKAMYREAKECVYVERMKVTTIRVSFGINKLH